MEPHNGFKMIHSKLTLCFILEFVCVCELPFFFILLSFVYPLLLLLCCWHNLWSRHRMNVQDGDYGMVYFSHFSPRNPIECHFLVYNWHSHKWWQLWQHSFYVRKCVLHTTSKIKQFFHNLCNPFAVFSWLNCCNIFIRSTFFPLHRSRSFVRNVGWIDVWHHILVSGSKLVFWTNLK